MALTVLVTNPTPDLYGASRMALESVAGFRERDWTVVVALPEPGPLANALAALGANVRFCPSPVLRKTYLSPLGLVRLAALAVRAVPAAVRLLRTTRPDVLYVNTITEPMWLVLGRLLRVPVVCHVHEGESRASRWMRRALAAPLLLANRLVVNSEFSARVARSAWPRLRDRSRVVLNGVAGPGEPPTAPRERLDPPVRLLYVGRLSERKGVRDAVESVAVLRERGVDARLDLVGAVFPGYESVEADLRHLVSELDIADRVHFRGFDPLIWPHLADSDVLVVPSRWDEPFGNTAVEGVLAARPVIATETSGLLEATSGFESAITVPPSAPEEIAGAVEQIVAGWPNRRHLAQRDAELAAQRHAPSRYRAEVAAIVESAARSAGTITDG